MPNAPVVFLVGTSTAGKSTICEALKEQDKSLPESERLNWQVWGIVLEMNYDSVRCEEYLKDNENYQKIRNSFPKPIDIFDSMISGVLRHKTADKPLILPLLKEDETKIDDAEFEKAAADFVEKANADRALQKKSPCYNIESVRTLRTLAETNPDNFKDKADFTMQGCNERMFDRAIKNSKEGKPTIIDVVPSGKQTIQKYFEDYAQSQNFSCPTHLTLIHVPIAELSERMSERNRQAFAEGGNPANARDGMFPFQQYFQVFGRDGEGLEGEKLYRTDLSSALVEFGANKKGKKYYEADNQLEAAMEAVKTTKEILKMEVGLEPGEESVTVGAKIKADAIYDNSKISNAQIAGKIQDWATKEMEKGSQEKTESVKQKSESWVSRMAARAASPTKQNEGR